MQRIRLQRKFSNQPVNCHHCQKQSPFFRMAVDHNKKIGCYECITTNEQLIKSIQKSYKDYYEQVIKDIPTPDTFQAEECLKILQKMNSDTRKIIGQVKKNIDKFQEEVKQFYVQSKIICEAYIQKIKQMEKYKIQDFVKQNQKIINQQKYVQNIKMRYKISLQINSTLERIQVKIPSIKQLIKKQQKEVKRYQVCQVPVHSLITIKGNIYFGTADGRIIYEKGLTRKQYKAHESLIRSFAYDGQYTLYSGSDDFKIKAWDLHDKELRFIAQFGNIQGVKSYHRDIAVFNMGKTLVSTRGQFDGHKMRVWQLKDYKNLKILDGHDDFIRGMVVNTKQQIFTASDDRTLKKWNTRNSNCIITYYHGRKIVNIMINASSQLLCIVDQDNKILILDQNNLNQITSWCMGKKILCSYASNLIYTGFSSQIIAYTWHGIKLNTFNLDQNFVPSGILQSDNRVIICDGTGRALQVPIEQFKLKSQK